MNLANLPCSRKSSKLEGHVREDGERGLFARQPIAKGEILTVFGGKSMNHEELMQIPHEIRRLAIQVADDWYLLSIQDSEGDWVNHSCAPNAGFQGQIVLVAMRDIDPGEEITFDYAMSDSTNYDEFDCMCGSPDCRGYVGGNDWRLPELQRRYKGFFSPHIQAKIEGLGSRD